MVKIKNNQLMMYDISAKYKEFLRKYDTRVSQKASRKFYGIIVSNDTVDYYIPFTSKINKRTTNKLTINIKDKDKIIAKLLLNNMIPVNIKDTKIININKSKYKNYYNKEIQYLRKENVKNELLRKINNIFNTLENKSSNDYEFFNELCCNFKLLESKCKEWNEKRID